MNRNAVLQKIFEPERRSGAFRLNSTTINKHFFLGHLNKNPQPKNSRHNEQKTVVIKVMNEIILRKSNFEVLPKIGKQSG
jgi:hypothetical protein